MFHYSYNLIQSFWLYDTLNMGLMIIMKPTRINIDCPNIIPYGIKMTIGSKCASMEQPIFTSYIINIILYYTILHYVIYYIMLYNIML